MQNFEKNNTTIIFMPEKQRKLVRLTKTIAWESFNTTRSECWMLQQDTANSNGDDDVKNERGLSI